MDEPPVTPCIPLAEALRPRSIGDVIGQRHLLGPGRPLDAVLKTGRAHAMILWGPPGVGKTTLARLIAEGVDSEFIALSAVMAGSAQIRAALEQAAVDGARGRRTTLFIDEIHCINKAQQELLRPSVRSGLITLIGATTENPSFALKSALLSRARVHVLEPLADDHISALHKSVRGSHPDAALYWLCRMLDGGTDRRYILRRLSPMAWDDIGLADPRAVQVVNEDAETWERLGAPEGDLALAQAAFYLAVADKSNAAAGAFGQAMAFVKHGGEVPSSGWYVPAPRGLESRIADQMARLRGREGGGQWTGSRK